MAQYIEEYENIDNELINKIINFVINDPNEFNKSLLYSSEKNEKFIDTNKRNSVFKTIVNEKLFEMLEEFIKKINNLHESYNYSLIKNDITFIKYEIGGFFNQHMDYLSFTSNIIKEHTLIICVDAECDGGETEFEINHLYKIKSSASKTPKNCLIFRKDLNHAGLEILNGYKHIITVNLTSVLKNSNKILVIEFPNNDKKFMLTDKQIFMCGKTFFSKLLEKNNDKIIIHKEEFISIEKFEIIYLILSECHITINNFEIYKDVIDYYSIDYQKIIIDSTISLNNSKNINIIPINLDDDIIILENDAQLSYYDNILKTKKLCNYQQFRIIFAEGKLTYGGNMSGKKNIKMLPVWMSLTQNNNILFTHELVTKSVKKFKFDIDPINNVLNPYKYKPNTLVEFTYNESTDICTNPIHFNSEDYYYKYLYNPLKIYNLNFCLYDFSMDNAINILTNANYKPMFITPPLDQNFTPNMYKSTIKLLEKINFFDKVLENINKMRILLPQKHTYIEHDFCNESVYGSCNLIMMCGLIKYC